MDNIRMAGCAAIASASGEQHVTRTTAFLPLAALLACAATLAGCVQEPQPRATVLRELDSGITSSNGGADRYLGNKVDVGVTSRVR